MAVPDWLKGLPQDAGDVPPLPEEMAEVKAIQEHNRQMMAEWDRARGPLLKPPSFVEGYIGEGGSRVVFAHENSAWVVKVAFATRRQTNRSEWNNWRWLQGNGYAGLVAPCIDIATDDSWLIMRRTTPAKAARPAWVAPWIWPDLIGDPSESNWGMLEGRPVWHDYQSIWQRANPSSRCIIGQCSPVYTRWIAPR